MTSLWVKAACRTWGAAVGGGDSWRGVILALLREGGFREEEATGLGDRLRWGLGEERALEEAEALGTARKILAGLGISWEEKKDSCSGSDSSSSLRSSWSFFSMWLLNTAPFLLIPDQ